MGASSSSQYKKDPEIRLSDAVRRGIVAAASVEGLLPATLTHTSLVFVPRVALHPSYPAITEIVRFLLPPTLSILLMEVSVRLIAPGSSLR